MAYVMSFRTYLNAVVFLLRFVAATYGYAHLKKQGYDIEAVSSYEKYSFDVDVLKAAM